MSEFDELQARLARETPPAPRPELRDEILGGVHRELHPLRLVRFALVAGILIAAIIGIEVQEAGHRRRVATLLAADSSPRVERMRRELSPYLSSGPLEVRLRLHARRADDRRWAKYVTALHQAGGNHG